MIINDWDPAFTKKYGTEFPRSYLCVDTEFTGSNEQDDLILEIGRRPRLVSNQACPGKLVGLQAEHHAP
jgi:hypothetical protein